MHSIEDIKRTIPQHWRQAATEYEKGNEKEALTLIYMGIDAVDILKSREIEAASSVSGIGEQDYF